MNKISKAVLIIIGAIGLTYAGSAVAANATETPPAYVLAIWEASPNLEPKFPQSLVASQATDSTDVHALDASAVKCGTTYQSDLYANDETTAALIAKGILNGNEESWSGGQYQGEFSNVFNTPDCVQPPDEVTPGSSEAIDCSTSIVIISNWHDTVTYTGDRTGYVAQPAVRTVDADTTRAATAVECPPVVVDQPSGPKGAEETLAKVPLLASTGIDAGPGFLLAGLLALVGAAMVVIPKVRRKV